jgi:hypothetical protein
MLFLGQLIGVAGLFLPAVLACNGYTGGLPKHTSTKSNSKVITVAAGQTFDCGWAKYDRGSGACNSQVEGGTSFRTLIVLLHQ